MTHFDTFHLHDAALNFSVVFLVHFFFAFFPFSVAALSQTLGLYGPFRINKERKVGVWWLEVGC